jgi:hypothetical protein
MSDNRNFQLNIDNFNLSDSDTDSDNDEHLSIAKLNVELLDKLELQYFPEPYNSLGQFILSSVVGASIAYIVKNRSSNFTKVTEYNDFLDMYYKYCINTNTSDNYLDDLILKLNLSLLNDNDKISQLLLKSNLYAKDIASNFFENNISILNESLSLPNEEFNIETLNVSLMKKLVPIIKFSKLSEIV